MMEVTVADAGGKSMSMLDFDGFKSSFFGKTAEYIRDVQKNLPKFEFLDDDVFIASYPKAGCTWIFEILTMLLTGQTRGHSLGREKGTTMLEATDAATIDNQPSPRVINSHLPVDRLPSDLFKKKIKTVYVIRNYRDITVSFYNFVKGMKHYNYDGKWADWLQLHLEQKITYGSYFSYAKQWEDAINGSLLPILVVYYEDLKENTVDEIRRLASFLDLAVRPDDKFLEEVAKHTQFDVMKNKYSEQDLVAGITFKEGTNFYRKGIVGDWKNWYTVAQDEQVRELTKMSMENYQTSIHFGAKYDI